MNVIFIMMKGMECLLSGKNIKKQKSSCTDHRESCQERMKRKMDGLGFIDGEKNREKKKAMRVCSILAWTVLIVMWAVLAAQSIGVMG